MSTKREAAYDEHIAGPDWPLRPEFEKALVHFLPPEPTFMTFVTVTKGKIDEP